MNAYPNLFSSRRPSSRVSYAVTGVLALVLSGCGLQADDAAAPSPPEVSVAEVTVRHLAEWDEFTGRISAVETVDLRPRVSGYIERVLFTEGQYVNEGDVLIEIDARSYRAAVEHGEAELERARSRADLADSEVERALNLARAQAISDEALEQRRAAAAQARADVRAAEAQLAVARLDLEFTRVRAPIGGRTGHAMVTAGNLAVADSTVLTTLVSLNPIHVYFESDEQTWLRHNGNARANGRQPENGSGANAVRVALADDPDFRHEGVLDFVDNRVNPATGTIRARAVLDNADGSFTPGLFARVRLIDNATRDVALIDDRAVLTDQNRRYVYVVDDEGVAQRRDVRLGRTVDGLRIVESGLSGGEHVVVNGTQKIYFSGMTVDPRTVSAGDRAPKLAAAPSSAEH